jgi:predicted RNA-binding Zn ribbon-like protein
VRILSRQKFCSNMTGVLSAPAPGEAGHPALALVNSRRNSAQGPVDDLATPAALGRWLGQHSRLVTTGADVDVLISVRDLRDAVRELLLARIENRVPERAALDLVNGAAAAAPTAARLEWDAVSAPRQTRDSVGAGTAQFACAVLATDAIDLVTGPEHAALRACGAPGCVRLLLSDHPRRQWCSTQCGDRVRASRYYHRHHAAGADRVTGPGPVIAAGHHPTGPADPPA